jgi:hypothetical protein
MKDAALEAIHLHTGWMIDKENGLILKDSNRKWRAWPEHICFENIISILQFVTDVFTFCKIVRISRTLRRYRNAARQLNSPAIFAVFERRESHGC